MRAMSAEARNVPGTDGMQNAAKLDFGEVMKRVMLPTGIEFLPLLEHTAYHHILKPGMILINSCVLPNAPA